MSNPRDRIVPPKPGYVNVKTVKEAPKKLLESPFTPISDWLVMSKIEEKFNLPGFKLFEFGYDKDRECQYSVLSSGPGARAVKDELGMVEVGTVVPTQIGRGDIVQVLERLCNKVEWTDGNTYHFVRANKVLFVIEP